MLNARFAIFLPVRNGAAYLRAAIGSVIAQSGDDWVLLVLDNASTDGSAEIAEEFLDARVNVFRSDRVLTIWESWHRIFEMLSGGVVLAEYVTIIGHDDCLLPSFLCTIESLVQTHPSASLYQTAYDLIDERGAALRPSRPVPAVESARDFIAARLWGIRDSVGTGYVFRAVDYLSVGGMPEFPFLLYADDLLFARLARLRFKVSCPDSHCQYRLHRRSASHTISRRRIEAQFEALEQYLDALESEFPELLRESGGTLALAALLSREVLAIRPIANWVLLSRDACDRVSRLEGAYLRFGHGIDYRQFLGTNFVTTAVYVYLKRFMLVVVLLFEKLKRIID